MNLKYISYGIAIVLSIAQYSSVFSASAADGIVINNPTSKKIIEGQILVHVKAGVSDADFTKLMKEKGLKVRHKIHKDSQIWIVGVTPKTEQKAIDEISTHRYIENVEADEIVEPLADVNDPAYLSQWALKKMQVPLAWDSGMGKGVIVGVVDSGVNYNHSDLSANMLPGWNFFNNNNDPQDMYGHGTLVAGIIGEVGNNGIGGAGVANKVKILPVRIASDTGGTSIGGIYQGMYWAYEHGASIINLSWGKITNDSIVNSAAKDLQSKGVLIVNGAENSGTKKPYTDSPYLLTVGATDKNDVVWVKSSFGSYVDLVAPGVDIYSTTRTGLYKTSSGTSFSTPMVVAVAALVKSVNPKLSPEAIEQILKETADDRGDVGYDIHYGYGRVNAAKAVSKAKSLIDNIIPLVAIKSPINGANITGDINISASASDNVGVDRVIYRINDAYFAVSKAPPYQVVWNTRSSSNGVAKITAYSFDKLGNRSSASNVTVTVNNIDSDTVPPSVTISTPVSDDDVSGIVNLTANAHDNVGVTQVNYRIDGVYFKSSKIPPYKVQWDTSSLSGFHDITALAVDAAGNKSLVSAPVSVRIVSGGGDGGVGGGGR